MIQTNISHSVSRQNRLKSFDNAPRRDLNFAGKVIDSVYHPYSWEETPTHIIRFEDLDIEAADVPDNCDHEYKTYSSTGSIPIGSKMNRADSLEHKGNKLLKFVERKAAEISDRNADIMGWFELERRYDNSWSAHISDFFNDGENKKHVSKERAKLKSTYTLEKQVEALTSVGQWLLGEAKGLKK